MAMQVDPSAGALSARKSSAISKHHFNDHFADKYWYFLWKPWKRWECRCIYPSAGALSASSLVASLTGLQLPISESLPHYTLHTTHTIHTIHTNHTNHYTSTLDNVCTLESLLKVNILLNRRGEHTAAIYTLVYSGNVCFTAP